MNWAAIRRVLALLRRRRPDVLHCHGFDANVVGIVAATIAGIPVRVAEEIGIAERSGRARLAASTAYRFAHRVIGVSNHVHDWLISEGVGRRKCVALYNPVVLPRVTAGPRSAGQPLHVGFVGRLEAVKNPQALVTAVSELIQSGLDIRLSIIGDGSQREALAEAIASRKVGQEIALLGYMDDPSAALATCHLYVQPSITEGFGIALVEAMACGLPALVTTTGGMVEIVEPGVTGWFLADPTTKSIEAALRNVLAQPPSELHAIGLSARASVLQRFEASVYMQTLEGLYSQLLASNTSRPT
jgi:glycosyltransferase involved in cell wall biosynthesis